MPLTTKQAAIVQSIGEYWQAHGYAPAMRDIQESTGIPSTNTVQYQLKLLRRRGIVAFDDELSRSVRLVRTAGGICPLCGCGGEHG